LERGTVVFSPNVKIIIGIWLDFCIIIAYDVLNQQWRIIMATATKTKKKKKTLRKFTLKSCQKISDNFYKRNGIRIPAKDIRTLVNGDKEFLKTVNRMYKKLDGGFDTDEREWVYYIIANDLTGQEWPCNGDGFETSVPFWLLMCHNSRKRGYALDKSWNDTLETLHDIVADYREYTSDESKLPDEIIEEVCEVMIKSKEYRKFMYFEQVRQGLLTDKQLKKGVVKREKLERKK